MCCCFPLRLDRLRSCSSAKLSDASARIKAEAPEARGWSEAGCNAGWAVRYSCSRTAVCRPSSSLSARAASSRDAREGSGTRERALHCASAGRTMQRASQDKTRRESAVNGRIAEKTIVSQKAAYASTIRQASAETFATQALDQPPADRHDRHAGEKSECDDRRTREQQPLQVDTAARTYSHGDDALDMARTICRPNTIAHQNEKEREQVKDDQGKIQRPLAAEFRGTVLCSRKAFSGRTKIDVEVPGTLVLLRGKQRGCNRLRHDDRYVQHNADVVRHVARIAKGSRSRAPASAARASARASCRPRISSVWSATSVWWCCLTWRTPARTAMPQSTAKPAESWAPAIVGLSSANKLSTRCCRSYCRYRLP